MKNGYNPSIMQDDLSCCYLCGRSDQKLDRHEIFGASRRDKSKRLGLWVMLCHDRCHLNGVHAYKALREELQAKCQEAAMREYGWDISKFISEFGRNYIA